MGWYRIKAVSHMTGIRPELLRMWERRYQLFTPHRSGNRYREYNDEDVQLLVYLRQQIDQGRSIGELAAEGREALLHQLAASMPAAVPPHTDASAIVEALAAVIQLLDARRLAQRLTELTALLPFTTFLTTILPSVMSRVGEQYVAGDAPAVCAYFAAMVFKQRLMAMLQATAPITPEAPVLLCACPVGEFHELGLLTFAYFMQHDGWYVTYLGPNVSPDVLLQGCHYLQPALVALSCTYRRAGADTLANVLHRIDMTIAVNYPTIIGGQVSAAAHAALSPRHLYCCTTLMEAQKYSRTIARSPLRV